MGFFPCQRMSLNRHHQSLAQGLYPSAYTEDTRFHLDTLITWISTDVWTTTCLGQPVVAARGTPGSGQGTGQETKSTRWKALRAFLPCSLALGFAVSLSRPPFHPTARDCLRRIDYPSTLTIFHLSIYHKGKCFRRLLLQSLSPLFQPHVVNLKEPPCCQPCTEFFHGMGLPFHVFFGSNPSHGGSSFPVKFWVEVFFWVWGKVL